MQKNNGQRVSFWAGVFMVGVVAVSLTVPAAGVRAAPAPFVGLDSYSGLPGSTVNVSGGNYALGEVVNIYLGSTLNPPTASSTARGDSLFGPVAIVIPPATIQGPLLITAVGASSTVSASNSFYVQGLNPSLSVASSTANTPGTVLSLNGSGFLSNEKVDINMGSASTTVTADSTGSFGGAALTIPMVNSGTYLIQAAGQASHANASTYFFVGGFFPTVTPSAFFLMPGNTVTFSGRGFAPNESVNLFVGSSTTSTAQFSADGGGNFGDAGAFMVPFSASSTAMDFTFRGSSSSAAVTVSIGIGQLNVIVTLSKYFLMPGEQLSFSGNGFAGGESVDVFNAAGFSPSSTPLTGFAADSTGAFSNAGSFAVPFTLASSSPTLLVRGRTSGATASAGVTIGAFSPSLTPSAYFLQRGNSFTLRATGFAPNESVTASVSGNSPQSAFADALGTTGIGPFTVSFTSPSVLNVTATGSLSGASASTAITVGDAVPRQVVTSTIAVTLNVDNGGAGAAGVSDFTVNVSGASATPSSFAATSTPTTVTLNGDTDFSISASSTLDNYVTSSTGTCSGQVLAGTNSATCNLTETYTPPIVISPGSLPGGTVGSPYSAVLSASVNASGTFVWTLSSGALPPGITFSASSSGTAVISGTPTTLGTSTFTVKAALGPSTKFQTYTLAMSVPVAATTTTSAAATSNGGGGGGGGGGGVFVSVAAPPVPYGGGGGGGGSSAPVSGTPSTSSTPATPGLPNTGGVSSVIPGLPNTGGPGATSPAAILGASLAQLAVLKQKLVVQSLAENSCDFIFSRNLRKGMSGDDVKNLQRTLNTTQFTQVSARGAGAPGNESRYFGPATTRAVAAFQNLFAEDILQPSGLSNGNGYVGPATRAKLNALCGKKSGENAVTRNTSGAVSVSASR